MAARPGGPEDFIFAEKSRERENAADGERRDQHRPECNRRVFAQPAHAHEILFSSHRVDHASGSEKEQRFKKRMGHQMKNAGRERAHSGATNIYPAGSPWNRRARA